MAAVSSSEIGTRHAYPTFPPAQKIDRGFFSHLPQAIAFMEVIFIFWEGRRTYQLVKELEGEAVTSEALLVTSVSLEFLSWCGEKELFSMSSHALQLVRKIYTAAKIVLYSQVVLNESTTLYKQREAKESKEAQCMHLQLISHLAYVMHLFLGAGHLFFGIQYPIKLLRSLQLTSLFFDVVSSQLFRHYFNKAANLKCKEWQWIR